MGPAAYYAAVHRDFSGGTLIDAPGANIGFFGARHRSTGRETAFNHSMGNCYKQEFFRGVRERGLDRGSAIRGLELGRRVVRGPLRLFRDVRVNSHRDNIRAGPPVH